VPHVLKLFRAPKRGFPMEELPEVTAIRELGFEGCSHKSPGAQRQVLLVDRESLDALELGPGMIRENITTEGLNVNGLQPGESLRVGQALFEVTMPCTPCGQMESLRPGLRKEIRGRRGMFCRVVRGGTIRQGDTIDKLA
jgi:MOSC domain-containing protein YiiM